MEKPPKSGPRRAYASPLHPWLTAEQARSVTASATRDLQDSQLEELLRMIEHQASLGYSRLQVTAFLYKPVRDSLQSLGYVVADFPAYTRIIW